MIKISTLTLASVLLSSCASTTMSTYTDPKYAGSTYSSFIVLSTSQNLREREAIESTGCKVITKKDAPCTRGLDLFPPTRTLSNEEYSAKVATSGMDGLLVVNVQDSYSVQSHTPVQFNTTYGYNNAITTMSGGNTINKPVVEYEVKLIDSHSGETVMVSSAKSKGNAFADNSDLAKSLVENLMRKMRSEHLFPQMEPKQKR